MSKFLDETTFVVVVRKFCEVFKSCEGGNKGCKNGWVPLQQCLFVFVSYSFASMLFVTERFVSFFHFFVKKSLLDL
jgi:hypothetical protein